jgi:hypothetical protein
MAVPQRLRRAVIERAQHRCEYCGLSDAGQAATYHIDHIIPQCADGPSTLENLALACIHCSLRKGARRSAVDHRTGKKTPLFNPRQQLWNHHFRWHGYKLFGITATGRVTQTVLQLNSPEHLIIRSFEKRLGRHPPPGHL